MKFLKITSFLLLTLTFNSCVVAVNSSKTGKTTMSQPHLEDISLNGKVYSALWQQNAGEFRALCYQAYNIGKMRIDEHLKNKVKKPLAIITDIDETFLDNSPYAVTEAEKGKEYDAKTWANWTAKAEARAYPGSVNFFNYVASKNVTVFYITNRDQNDKAGTLKNLQNLGYPFADEAHLMLRKDTSDKEARRLEVLENYDVILYLGDNLADFSKIFNKKPQAERNELVDQNSNQFGSRFIVLPNSGYGDWETALPGYNYQLTPSEKDEVILKNLRGY